MSFAIVRLFIIRATVQGLLQRKACSGKFYSPGPELLLPAPHSNISHSAVERGSQFIARVFRIPGGRGGSAFHYALEVWKTLGPMRL